MRQKIFKLSKTLMSIVGSYLWLLCLAVLMIYCICINTGKINIQDNVILLMSTIIDFVIANFSIVIYLSAIFTLLTILLSSMSKIKQILSSIVFIIYLLCFSSLYAKFIDVATSRFGTDNSLVVSFIQLMGYMLAVLLIELVKGVFKLSKLTVIESTIKHKKVDDLITEYYSPDVKFNMSLCDELIDKYTEG